jgi:Flp pilus assembly protein TadG
MSLYGQRGQSSVEFGLAAVVLLLLALGLTDLGRVFYFGVGLMSAVREGARQATWFDPNPGATSTCAAAPNCYLYDGAIKSAVDGVLASSGLPASALQNSSGTTCPTTSDGNTQYNPPYTNDAYAAGGLNQPLLFICYENTPGMDLTSAPTDNSLKGQDVNVILVMSFGFATGFMQGVLGDSVHLAVNAHMIVGGF